MPCQPGLTGVCKKVTQINNCFKTFYSYSQDYAGPLEIVISQMQRSVEQAGGRVKLLTCRLTLEVDVNVKSGLIQQKYCVLPVL